MMPNLMTPRALVFASAGDIIHCPSYRDLLCSAPDDELPRPEPDAQSRSSHRTGDNRADVHHHRERHRSVSRWFRFFHGLYRGNSFGENPVLGVLALLACIGVYAQLGAIIHIRNLPSSS